jgi:hypothetical protein
MLVCWRAASVSRMTPDPNYSAVLSSSLPAIGWAMSFDVDAEGEGDAV